MRCLMKIMELLPYLDRSQLEIITSRIILSVGMTPLRRLQIPPPVDGIPWDECFARGLDRIDKLGQVALEQAPADPLRTH